MVSVTQMIHTFRKKSGQNTEHQNCWIITGLEENYLAQAKTWTHRIMPRKTCYLHGYICSGFMPNSCNLCTQMTCNFLNFYQTWHSWGRMAVANKDIHKEKEFVLWSYFLEQRSGTCVQELKVPFILEFPKIVLKGQLVLIIWVVNLNYEHLLGPCFIGFA